MGNLYVRVRPGVGSTRVFCCGFAFSLAWLLVVVDQATSARLKADQRLQTSVDLPDPGAVVGSAAVAVSAGLGDSVSFGKPGRGRCLLKTGHSALSVAAGTMVVVSGKPLVFISDTPVVMPLLVAGTDYAVYVCSDGSARADASFSVPLGYTASDSRKIGGFHFGLVAPGTTPAEGGFNTVASSPLVSMVWTQGSVDDISGINKHSIWDMSFRPACSDPRGMVCVQDRFWVDIYFTGSNHVVLGTSVAGSDIASGGVLPKIPPDFGGNGLAAYASLTWYGAAEIAFSHGKRLLSQQEFSAATFGVTENNSLGGSGTPPLTLRQPGSTSKVGVEQSTGHIWCWGEGAFGVGAGWISAPGRGSSYGAPTAPLLGGARDNGSYSGSRASSWGNPGWYPSWNLGLRCACDHLQLS